ncbi:hypothetical protein NLM33_35245 [Bradyrhizobium sp. CCGUVB1N3]|uniref:hypothetical protein n=1 Tax=Bradyrhizobium sp. CCGUVB1N3 TaxID=2949629 RepID=UPI0020B25136|nr:hypothetical protein [Bradyrhizobium sp. CCGUVB1N3]MCP3475544.1 hypothetical protein [Bradyrhizobium sp. CCGUVB1N3]
MTKSFLVMHLDAGSTAGRTAEFTPWLDWAKPALRAAAFVVSSISAIAPYATQAAPATDSLNWSSSTQSNGASAVTAKQSILPFWDTWIGADMTVARQPATMLDLLAEKAANGGNVPQSSGNIWAVATAPGAGVIWDKTVVEARVDPGAESSKIGASLTRAVPLPNVHSLTLQIDCNVLQQGKMSPFGIGGQVSNYETHQSAKVTIGRIGTSFVVGQSMSTTDDKWLRTFGAEQKLFEGVTIASSIGETAQGTTNMSLTAGFKKSW